ncbi:class I SAM-dependent methyltransferase [Natrarchaeobaculum sulfurireducens]|uniref:Methyltransferase type 11 n=1 Tax=Natrarchaeobaculum sulfurireducens TaxID=2044521 RepID=A0A346PLR6_9EURY|nr:class I SAM-dependent methyltransferase [Natrarchaeobaculum sulfurireducens]AXR76791.1 SAM-dependent methyltransferase [Natrarchaeobaculum sulfurireducens]AXR80461.1 methyltransferase type 11 [Natrarchaeobaculum sulfurireducens]
MTTKVDYLTAKRTIDDRALDRRVWDRFVDALPDRNRDDPVRIVEVGAGVGSMISRLAAWESLPEAVSYRAVDLDSSCVTAAHERLPHWLEDAGYDVESYGEGLVASRVDGGTETHLEVTLEVADGFALDDDADAVIGAAVFDLVDLESTLARVRGLLRDGGVLYAPITFDGGTRFAPAHPLDGRIERHYHRHMDEIRDQPGSSRAGRELLEAAPKCGFDVVAAGGSDWLVHSRDGHYPDDEATVVEHVLETIEGALADYPPSILEPSTRDQWLETRRTQLDRGDLVFVAHHLDVVARV